ncbi:MAG: hypothetical protein R2690_16520 [Acidimicrobiales bacterium]
MYEVTIATDVNFTNVIKTYTTGSPSAPEGVAGRRSGRSGPVLVRQALLSGPLRLQPSTFAGDPNSPVFAFRKQSAGIEPLTPAPGATDADEITFTWRRLPRHQPGPHPVADPGSRALSHPGLGVPDFSSNVHTGQLLDETTATSPSELYPDGPLYWRVQSRDNTGNLLT